MTLRLLILAGIFFVLPLKAQNLFDNYHYIKVPDLFEFQRGKNQYQINDFVVFQFNKHGFNAFLDNKLPLYLQSNPCKGLKALIEDKSGFIYTKFVMIIQDCQGREVYRSQEGRSKLKDRKKAYMQALRMAFESFGDMEIKQKDHTALKTGGTNNSQAIIHTPVVKVLEITKVPEKEIEIVKLSDEMVAEKPLKSGLKKIVQVEEVIEVQQITKQQVSEKQEITLNPKVKHSNKEVKSPLSYINKDYSLQETSFGFNILSQEGSKVGKLVKTGGGNMYFVKSSLFEGLGYKTETGFVIEREVKGTDVLVKIIFAGQ